MFSFDLLNSKRNQKKWAARFRNLQTPMSTTHRNNAGTQAVKSPAQLAQQHHENRQKVIYVLTFFFGFLTLIGLLFAIIQTARSVRIDKVLVDQNERLLKIDRYLVTRFGDLTVSV